MNQHHPSRHLLSETATDREHDIIRNRGRVTIYVENRGAMHIFSPQRCREIALALCKLADGWKESADVEASPPEPK